MSKIIGVVMDPIQQINYHKDSTLAMLLEAQQRGWQIQYMELTDLFARDGIAYGHMRQLTPLADENHYFQFGHEQTSPLGELDIILMRKDPPFDMEFIYATYLLELAEKQGAKVVNKPASLRDINEKMYTAWFPQCCVETLITRDQQRLKDFLAQYQDIIIKPLDGMGGEGIYRLTTTDPNIPVILSSLTQSGQRYIMAQRYLAAIKEGDKRILVINGQAVPHTLARMPAKGETRANLAAGGTGVGMPITEREQWICQQVGPVLKDKGILFAGLDVIGGYLTEINVTSPTCIREIDTYAGINVSALFLDSLL